MNWKLITASLLVALPVLADEFQAANQLYDAGKFAEAAAAYEKIEPKTAHIYYNAGNAWFRQDKLGLAILNYEHARRLAPRDPDIQANLKFAQQRLGVDEVNAPPRTVDRLLRLVTESRTVAEWSAYELAGLWLTALAIAACIYFPKMRTGLVIVCVAGIAVLAVTVFALSNRMITGVVTAGTEARFAPLPDSTVHFRLAEGTKVAVREDRGQWLFVERADGQQGWVKTEALGRVVPL